VPVVQPSSPKLPIRIAMEAGDLPAVVDSFAPDAVVRSPFTSKMTFNGHEQIGAITKVILEVLEDFHYTDEVRSGSSAFLVSRARVGGLDIEMVDHLQLNDDEKIQDFTVFFRPLPASAVAMRLIGAKLGRRRGQVRAAAISTLATPLAFMTRVGDGVGVRMVRSTV
jgi:hypothetical protein